MYTIFATSFTMSFSYPGILPGIPLVNEGQAKTRVSDLLNAVFQLGPDLYLGTGDSYWFGKRLGKIADLVMVADQIGELNIRDTFVSNLKQGLENWFKATDGDGNFFYYDANAGSLIGYVCALSSVSIKRSAGTHPATAVTLT